MDYLLNKLSGAFCHRKEYRIIMVGLRESGKTCILYKLVSGEFPTTIPTIGLNVERVDHGDLHLEIWDIGYGGGKLGPHWRQHFHGASGIIWVVDAADPEEPFDPKESPCIFGHSCQELWDYVLSAPECSGLPLLVLANKLDLPNTTNIKEIADALKLSMCVQPYHIIGCSAITEEGIGEGLDWLAQQLMQPTTVQPL
ncbi:unnamed protein product [Meganyctiphanes norvegica]|uniref:ADP-ribosylation factor-like protein 6 n=1 Tax=Meganyctiphanes norvegica TaxID=48144 RepID=A0AAV2S8F4_MEGNR